jgi:glycerol uptake facilitator protein
MLTKQRVAALAGEFAGVAVLTSVLLAISKSGVGFSYFIASGVALSVAALSILVGSVSGAHFNPAVTIALWTNRSVGTIKAISYVVAQFLGGVAAWKLYVYLVSQPLNSIAPKTFEWRVMWAEVIGALVIGFAYSAAVSRRKWGAKYAVTIAGGVFLGMMVASLASNGVVNPAIALGVRSWSVAYIAGPIVGALFGANIYTYLFATDAEASNGFKFAALSAKSSSSSKVAKKKSAAKKKPVTKRKK